MNRICLSSLGAIAVVAFSLFISNSSFAQGTAFNYQGQLYDGGNTASGIYDLRFWIYDSTNNPGVIIAGPVTNSAVFVTNGLFSVQIDFGSGVFTGPDRWLQIAVRTNGALTFTNLSPRQQITPTPYAIFANSASNLVGVLPASQLSGTLPASAFSGYTNTVALTNSANLFAGSFSGNGANVTNVNVANLTGVLVPGQLPSNTAYVNSNQTFTASNNFTGPNNFSGTNFFGGQNTFANRGNNFTGSFFGNGLVGWTATNGTAVQADIDHGYLLTNTDVATVTLPSSATVGDIVRVSGAGASGWKVAQNANQSIMGNFLNFGQTWEQTHASAANWNCIASSADGRRLAATALGGDVYVSSDSGQTWSSTGAGGLSSASWRAVASSADGSRLVAVVYGGSLYTSTNFGSSWQGNSGVSGNLYSVATSADGRKSVAVVYGGSIYTNSGTAWAAVGGTSPGNWISVASSDDGSKLVAAITGGSIYISSNSGRTWSAASGTSGKSWQSVASSSDGSKLAAAINNASSGGIYISTDSGSSWTHTSAPAKTWLSIASSADGNRLVAVSDSGSIYTSGNGGTTWQQQTNGFYGSPSWESVASSADGSKLAAVIFNASSGGIYTSQSSIQTTTTTVGTSGFITGGQGTAVELQYIGNNQWMPVSSAGTIWAY
ncbi:MAG TPA: hypothetical protein VFV23_03120 [Verrucomicrobiae bacterium]|nr:hypothetical protein [Verrucomicrobiae bacterium]